MRKEKLKTADRQSHFIIPTTTTISQYHPILFPYNKISLHENSKKCPPNLISLLIVHDMLKPTHQTVVCCVPQSQRKTTTDKIKTHTEKFSPFSVCIFLFFFHCYSLMEYGGDVVFAFMTTTTTGISYYRVRSIFGSHRNHPLTIDHD